MRLELLATAAGVLTAALGAYVAYLAYDGWRRNDSEPMRQLAVGVVFVAVVPYLLTYGVSPLAGLSDGATILGVTIAHLVGLGALARSVT